MQKAPELQFIVPKQLHAVFPTIDNSVIPLRENGQLGLVALSCRHHRSYTVAVFAVHAIAAGIYETAHLVKVFVFSNIMDKTWFVEHLPEMKASRVIAYAKRQYRSKHPVTYITATNESEVKRAERFLRLSQRKRKGEKVIALL